MEPTPMSNAELIKAIDGYRYALDEFAQRTSMNLLSLREALQARLDAIKS
jgi:hypothetical protein